MPHKRVRIVQIFDLHINRKVDGSVTEMLQRLLKKIEPDVLIVSGDLANQPLPWQMKKAAKFVDAIKVSSNAKAVIVIPGNHDFKFWGNIGFRRLTRIPFEFYFRSNGVNRRAWQRVAEIFRLALNSLYWNGRAMREPTIVNLFLEWPEWGFALFAVHSNSLSQMMAAGKVESRDLQELYRLVDESDKSSEFAFCYKVAVVHHHPAPIAEAPTDAIDRIQDSFMIFYNAGRFLQELSRRGFNLLLHGHKHVAGFLRIECEFKDQGRSVLPIAAAGTASHPSPDDSRGHHFHVIDIFDDDTASLDSWFFSSDVERKEESRSYELDTLEDVRRRRYAMFRNLKKHFSGEIRKSVQITSDGYTAVQIDYRDSRVFDEQGLECIPFSLTTARPSYLRGVETAKDASGFVTINRSEESLYRFAGAINFGQSQTPGGGPFQFGYRYRLMNGHALTDGEFARHYGRTTLDSEYASLTCDGACELMTLSVAFPPRYELDSLEFRAIAEYVAAPLRGIDDDRLDRGNTKRHDQETERIRGNLKRLQHENGYLLTCPMPVPGMIYKLCWKFRKLASEPKPELAVTAEVAVARLRLLNMAMNAARDPQADRDWSRARTILATLAADLDAILPGVQEVFDITVMVFDEESQRLKFVCSNANPATLPAAEFFAGEGCAGFAFEKARYVLYHPDRDAVGYFIHQHEWPNGQRIHEPVVLASFPWIHNPTDDQRRLVVGVVNVSSMLTRTKLLNLFDVPDDNLAGMMKTMQELANLAASGLINL